MGLYSKQELERWIDEIDQRTVDRLARVSGRLARDDELLQAVRAREDGRERIFAALATGNLEYLRDQDPDWSSWIEGDPPYLLLLMKSGVVVDLVTPRHGVDGFLETYGCTPRQLAALARHRPNERPGPILLNIRDDDTSGYVSDWSRRDVIGPILAVSREFPDRFYRLRPIREAAFRLLGVDYETCLAKGQRLAERYESPAIAGMESDHLRLITRSGNWPNKAQLAHRLAYYFIAQELWGDEARDPRLDEWVGEAERPINFANQQRGELAGQLARLYVRHHVFTAPLTGGLGGGYTMRAPEANAIFQTFRKADVSDEPEILREVANRRDQSGRTGIASWIFGQIVGQGDADSARLTYSPLRRYPVDEEWQQFLGRVDRNRLNLIARDNAKLRELEGALTTIEPKLRDRGLSPEIEAEFVRNAIAAGARSGINGINFLCAAGDLVDLAGPSAGSIGVVCQTAINRFRVCVKLSEGIEALSPLRERMCGWINGLCRRRTAGLTITRFQGMLDRAA